MKVNVFVVRSILVKRDLIPWKLVHCKMGHISRKSLITMARNNTLSGLRYRDINWDDTQKCEICSRANMVADPVPRQADRDPGDSFIRGSVDLYGPVNIPSVGGNKYALVYCDDHNSYGMMEFTGDKSLSSIYNGILKWKLKARDHGYDLQQLQFDADSIFESRALQDLLREKMAITSRFASVGRHQSNGLVERMIRTIVFMARAMLLASGLPKRYWTYAMAYALMIYNATMRSRFKKRGDWKYKSPFHVLTKHEVVFDFPIFGCLAVVKGPMPKSHPQWVDRGRRGVFLGFDTEHHDSYLVMALDTGRIVSSKQAHMFEDFYGWTGYPTDYYRLHPDMIRARKIVEDRSEWMTLSSKEDMDIVTNVEDEGQTDHLQRAMMDMEMEVEDQQGLAVPEGNLLELQVQPQPQQLRRSERLGHKVDRVRMLLEDESIYDAQMKRLKNDYDEGFDEEAILCRMMNVKSRFVEGSRQDVPQTFKEATSSDYLDKFGDPIESELRSIYGHNVFDMDFKTSIPHGVDVVDTKFVFDIKNVTTGGIPRYKARLTIRGFFQQWLKSYFETYSPTTQKDSLREILALAAMYVLRTIHVDIKTAFLYGELKEEEILYCKVDESFMFRGIYKEYCTEEQARVLEEAFANGQTVYTKMVKSCYGTKQASKNWFEKLDSILVGMGFESTPCDPCMYIRRDGEDFMLIVCYVDDIFGTGTNDELFDHLVEGLQQELDVVNLGEITQCLGMVVTRYEDGSILLNNEIYIDNMLETFDMQDCGFDDTPGVANSILSIADCVPKEAYVPEVQDRYRSLIGSLLYCAICWRPSILQRVTQCARFTGVAGEVHVRAANRILKNLKKTKNFGLFFKAGRRDRPIRPMFIHSVDAAHAADEDKVSTSGSTSQMVDADDWENRVVDPDDIDILPDGNCTAYSSTRQKGVLATSSTEAEYVAAADKVKKIKHSSMKWQALGFKAYLPERLYTDNSAIIDIAGEWKLSDRTRHIDIRYHHIRVAIHNGEIQLLKVDTKANISDMLTKCLDTELFERFRDKLEAGTYHPDYRPKRRRRASRYQPSALPEDKSSEELEDKAKRGREAR